MTHWANMIYFILIFTILPRINCCSYSLTPNPEKYSAAVCPEQFEGKCKCGFKMYGFPLARQRYVTNCTHAGFTDAAMLKHLPSQTEILIFTGNLVPDLPLNIFGKVESYSCLHAIDMSHNHIQTIKGKTFHGVNNVKSLVLDNNDIYIVNKDHHPRVFSNFENLEKLSLRNAFTEKMGDYSFHLNNIFVESELITLKELHLENNEIQSLKDDTFCPMDDLEKLYLGNNFMYAVSFNISCLKRLRTLDLGNNMLPYLSTDAIAMFELHPGIIVNLTGNPFRCDCSMLITGTYDWFLQRSKALAVDQKTFHCSDGYPQSNVGKLVSEVPRSLLRCRPALVKDHKSHHTSAAVAVLGTIIVLICVLLLATVYANRIRLTTWMTNVVRPIVSKQKYSSLDKEAECEMQV